jgi:dihydroxyacetone kinase-like predicted kinase
MLTGEGAPPLGELRAWLEDEYPELEVEVAEGGQPHYALLVSAE